MNATDGTHPWLLTEEAKTISDALLGVWDDAEANDDQKTVEKVKDALNYLQLPWVRLED